MLVSAVKNDMENANNRLERAPSGALSAKGSLATGERVCNTDWEGRGHAGHFVVRSDRGGPPPRDAEAVNFSLP